MDTQTEFKAELDALLHKYNVEMSVLESTEGYTTHVDGIQFWAYTKYDGDQVTAEYIDLLVPAWYNGK